MKPKNQIDEKQRCFETEVLPLITELLQISKVEFVTMRPDKFVTKIQVDNMQDLVRIQQSIRTVFINRKNVKLASSTDGLKSRSSRWYYDCRINNCLITFFT